MRLLSVLCLVVAVADVSAQNPNQFRPEQPGRVEENRPEAPQIPSGVLTVGTVSKPLALDDRQIFVTFRFRHPRVKDFDVKVLIEGREVLMKERSIEFEIVRKELALPLDRYDIVNGEGTRLSPAEAVPLLQRDAVVLLAGGSLDLAERKAFAKSVLILAPSSPRVGE